MEENYHIKEQLKNPNAEVRRVGVEKIAALQTEDALTLLFDAIGDQYWRVRKTAVDSLLRYSDFKGFYKRVFAALEAGDNAGKRNAAVEIVTKLGAKAVAHITEYLFNANFEVKKFLIDALGDIKDVNSSEVVAKLLDDDDENVRSSAAETLGKIKDPSSVKHLVSTLKRDDLQLQFCALEALESIGEPIDIGALIPLLDSKILRKAAFEVMGKSKDDEVVKYLVNGISDTSKASREAAIKAVVNIYNSISDENSKQKIIQRLNEAVTKELLDRIPASLSSAHEEVQKAVISLLGYLKAVKTIPKLLEVQGDESIKACIFDSIVFMGKESFETIKEVFLTADDSTKDFLAQVMGALKDERYEPLLVESLKSGFWHLRSSAAISLAQLAKGTAIKHIFPVLNDQYKDVQMAALDALTALGNLYPKEIRREIESHLSAQDEQLKINVISLIGRIGIDEDIKHLDMALKDSNPEVRTAAVYAIGAINVLAESKHLVLTLTDESDKVRIAVAKTLGLLYSEESFNSLILALNDPNVWVKINAMRSLAKLQAADAVRRLRKFLQHDDPILVINAIESLKELNAPELKIYLLELLRHKDYEVVKASLGILKESMDDNILKNILELLSSAKADIRILIYKSFEGIKDDNIVQKLTPFIEKEEDEMIQRMAKRVLGIIS